jgi:hypothetical protein
MRRKHDRAVTYADVLRSVPGGADALAEGLLVHRPYCAEHQDALAVLRWLHVTPERFAEEWAGGAYDG